MTDAEDVAATIAAAWVRIAADTTELDEDSPWLADPGGRDWLYLRLTEWHRADIGAAVVHLLPQGVSLPVAGLCARDIVRACNEAYGVIAWRIATAAVAGGDVDAAAAAAVSDAEPALRQEISRAIERALARG
jgi:hypothetical protein